MACKKSKLFQFLEFSIFCLHFFYLMLICDQTECFHFRNIIIFNKKLQIQILMQLSQLVLD